MIDAVDKVCDALRRWSKFREVVSEWEKNSLAKESQIYTPDFDGENVQAELTGLGAGSGESAETIAAFDRMAVMDEIRKEFCRGALSEAGGYSISEPRLWKLGSEILLSTSLEGQRQIKVVTRYEGGFAKEERQYFMELIGEQWFLTSFTTASVMEGTL